MSWKKLLESVSESLNDHLRLRNDYPVAENRILRNQIDGRVQLTDSERKELSEIGAKLGRKVLTEIATVATPDTILKRHSISPASERKKTVTWREFVRCHWDVLWATSFFNSDVWSWFGLIVSFLLRVIYVGRHHVQLAKMMRHQQMPGIQSLLGCFNVSPRVSIWVCIIQERSRAIRSSEMVWGYMASEDTLVDAREPRSQHMGKVVDVSAARHRQIRDGPVTAPATARWTARGWLS